MRKLWFPGTLLPYARCLRILLDQGKFISRELNIHCLCEFLGVDRLRDSDYRDRAFADGPQDRYLRGVDVMFFGNVLHDVQKSLDLPEFRLREREITH